MLRTEPFEAVIRMDTAELVDLAALGFIGITLSWTRSSVR